MKSKNKMKIVRKMLKKIKKEKIKGSKGRIIKI